MIGFIDVGGGMRGIYTSGIYDYLMDKSITPEYCIGVSAGSANLITYVAGQRGRTYRFYKDYSFEKEYMSFNRFINDGSFINLNYIYSGISNSTGKDPLCFEQIEKSKCIFHAVATDAETGQPCYFKKSDFYQDDYSVLKASCAIPIACKPIKIKEKLYFDGGVSDPVPYKKAFADGCDKVVVCITHPADFIKRPTAKAVKLFLKKYPETAKAIIAMNGKYNRAIKELKELEKQGSALIIAPNDVCGVGTLTRQKEKLEKLYRLGYNDAQRIERFIKSGIMADE